MDSDSQSSPVREWYTRTARAAIDRRQGSHTNHSHGILSTPGSPARRQGTCGRERADRRTTPVLRIEMDAYLDIETTGLNPWADSITIVGICRDAPDGTRMLQLVGHDITLDSVESALEGVTTLHTYNGAQFDMRFLEAQLNLKLPATIVHRDLMYDCWRRNLYGGLKSVERQLGIARNIQGVSGREAVTLWWRYVENGDLDALERLLAYNREDVENLLTLRRLLDTCNTV